ncbi:hypothetical protein MJO28_006463 [Puccinia striiformis f. sp. tritici]|uniref:Uncharacterized protein n=2 Tax=Puccinia striiformis TaxID=27350 RepID=A0A2S4VAH0_9BASI|nr:hypothetical protein MJO28_006463 [Puccinia striiformis f. sp. tritici]KAI7958224.1 hypothetical protein MJO29_006441 [Puccinia striiformis f. sp. tritici]POW06478.1 hypothetical protein PSTT_08944 [Puccinia striiformis]
MDPHRFSRAFMKAVRVASICFHSVKTSTPSGSSDGLPVLPDMSTTTTTCGSPACSSQEEEYQPEASIDDPQFDDLKQEVPKDQERLSQVQKVVDIDQEGVDEDDQETDEYDDGSDEEVGRDQEDITDEVDEYNESPSKKIVEHHENTTDEDDEDREVGVDGETDTAGVDGDEEDIAGASNEDQESEQVSQPSRPSMALEQPVMQFCCPFPGCNKWFSTSRTSWRLMTHSRTHSKFRACKYCYP